MLSRTGDRLAPTWGFIKVELIEDETMTSNEMEIGIIGSGKAGTNFAHAIQSLPNVKVRAFCAAHEKNAKAAAELFDAPIWTSDYQSILKDDPPVSG